MPDIVIDTHAAIWYFANSSEISVLATEKIDNTIENGDSVILSTISIVEIIYLIDKSKLVPQTLTRLMQYLKLPKRVYFARFNRRYFPNPATNSTHDCSRYARPDNFRNRFVSKTTPYHKRS